MSEHKANPFARGTGVDLPPIVRDLYGRSLKEGDKILLSTPQVPQLYTVKTLAPNVDPTLPENQMVVVLVSAQRFLATRDQRNPEFVLVIPKADAVTPAAEPPAARLSLVPEGEAS